jgi:hypothetical protein
MYETACPRASSHAPTSTVWPKPPLAAQRARVRPYRSFDAPTQVRERPRRKERSAAVAASPEGGREGGLDRVRRRD